MVLLSLLRKLRRVSRLRTTTMMMRKIDLTPTSGPLRAPETHSNQTVSSLSHNSSPGCISSIQKA